MDRDAGTSPTLSVRNLKTHFFLREGILKAVDGVSFDIYPSKTLGLIGESGCGKSVTAQSLMALIDHPGKIVAGSIDIHHTDDKTVDVASLNPRGKEIRKIRGSTISMVFQEPMTSFSPVHTVGDQIAEAVMLHREPQRERAMDIVVQMLDRVGIPSPRQRAEEFPYQLSGGMRQRAMIAMALACNPRVLIADEPTTALDVTVQAQILDLLAELQEEFRMGMLYITHDLGVVAGLADEVAVMYLGKIVERGPIAEVFDNPLHPYTRRLLASIPKRGASKEEPLAAIPGTVPTPIDLPRQCGFVGRCDRAISGTCTASVPALVETAKSHEVRCFLHSNTVEDPDDE